MTVSRTQAQNQRAILQKNLSTNSEPPKPRNNPANRKPVVIRPLYNEPSNLTLLIIMWCE